MSKLLQASVHFFRYNKYGSNSVPYLLENIICKYKYIKHNRFICNESTRKKYKKIQVYLQCVAAYRLEITNG